MEKSWKNLLQEYCQKNNLALPEYISPTRIDKNKDNEPIWKSVVKIFDDSTFYGIANDKKGAEMTSAKNAYEHIMDKYKQIKHTKHKIVHKQKVDSIYKIEYEKFTEILLVDGENCDVDVPKLSLNILVMYFVAKNTTKKIIFEHQEKYDNCYIFISECVGKDAADHLLTFNAGILSTLVFADKIGKQFYVLTRDHYGEYLEKFMNNCKFICSTDDIT